MTYSLDLRKKAIEYVKSGGTLTSAANIFGVRSRTIWNWIQRKKQGILEPKKYETSPRKIDNDQLKLFIKKYPDAYLREIAEEFDVGPSAVFYALKRLKITLKKRRAITKKGMKKREKILFKK
jgi:transposase